MLHFALPCTWGGGRRRHYLYGSLRSFFAAVKIFTTTKDHANSRICCAVRSDNALLDTTNSGRVEGP